ncbi:hypothetical protein [Geminicoccus roseus]|uniref:hypothetical protein n=1 Tax=Geminicoccus roseus TaxID=404900 RepID=UPI00041978C3|nr:hypothetical protein [Geminicoccus roseus]
MLKEFVLLRRVIRHAQQWLRRRRIQVARLLQGEAHRRVAQLLRYLGWVLERLLQRRWNDIHG